MNMINIPSVDVLKELIREIRRYVFPEIYGNAPTGRLEQMLVSQVGPDVCAWFMGELPQIKELLCTDVEAVVGIDPATDDRVEVILCYPAIEVMLHYRTAHALKKAGVPRIPRIITELAHSSTGIDIHPSASVGSHFAIDHGTGIVIGETAIIGNHVTLYQGVTLGAKKFAYDGEGLPLNTPRHPILEDNVTVYSNTSILGRVTIGEGSVIGGNVWLTRSVPPGSRVLQSSPVSEN